MNPFPLSLLAVAAELRAGGASWELIGKRMNRHPDTCRHWPARFPATWHRLIRAAEDRNIAAAAGEALTLLRKLMREGSERTKTSAAQTLFRGRLTLRSGEEAPNPSREEQIEIISQRLDDSPGSGTEKQRDKWAAQAEQIIEAEVEGWAEQQDPHAALVDCAIEGLVDELEGGDDEEESLDNDPAEPGEEP